MCYSYVLLALFADISKKKCLCVVYIYIYIKFANLVFLILLNYETMLPD